MLELRLRYFLLRIAEMGIDSEQTVQISADLELEELLADIRKKQSGSVGTLEQPTTMASERPQEEERKVILSPSQLIGNFTNDTLYWDKVLSRFSRLDRV